MTLGLSSSSVAFHLPMFVLIPFVMMNNKDIGYISNLSTSVDGPTWLSSCSTPHPL
jgi:hypothetical protein